MQLRIKLKYYTHSSGASLQILTAMHARQKYVLLFLARLYACFDSRKSSKSMQQISSLEVRGLSASQELYRIPRKKQVHHSVHNSLPLAYLLSEIQPLRVLF
jgi:hypothetical protein